VLLVDVRAHPDRRSGTGDKVHASGVRFDDTSGVRLRQWMGISRQQFYDPQLVAVGDVVAAADDRVDPIA